ncbi:MAG: copper transporter, partial [Actinomycetota bacterium]|nr:copper transporter [Actinomycetota bacterium]
AYTDPSRGGDIDALATGEHPSALTLPQTSDARQLGAALLAFVLLGRGLATDVTQVIGGFSALHMVSVAGSIQPSTTVVVIGTGALPNGDYAAQAGLALVAALVQGGGHVVVAGDAASATAAGIVAAVRGPAGEKSSVSTVDNADTAIGQISTILAVADAIKGTVGQYGTGKGAGAVFPVPSK